MCFPCWPFSDVYLEDDPLEPARRNGVYQYEWNGQQWVLKPTHKTMSSSPPSSPTPSRQQRCKQRNRRVSFGLQSADVPKPKAFSLASFPYFEESSSFPSTAAAAAASAAPAPTKSRSHRHRHNHHPTPTHSDTNNNNGNTASQDRRARVDDTDDEVAHADHAGASSKTRGKKSRGNDNGTGNENSNGNTDGQPPATKEASTINGPFKFGSGVDNNNNTIAANVGPNPAIGVNTVFTHTNGPSVPFPGYPVFAPPPPQQQQQQQSFAIPGFPGFAPAGATMPPGLATGPPQGTMAATAADSLAATGVSFSPAVPDATNGPMVHTYVPRNDVPLVAVPGPGGVGAVYLQPQHYQLYLQQLQQLQQPQPQQLSPTTAPGIPLGGIAIASTTAPMMPVIAQPQPGQPQPVIVQPVPMVYSANGGVGGAGGPPMMMNMGMGMPGTFPGGTVHPEPALGVGQTAGETLQEQIEFAHANNMYEPQDFKPADDDKSRFYWVRELDNNWTQRSRATIDHIGCRWYITDGGVFYAVRLPN
ncbi:hypothetical protein SPI_00437 [Niveomyces insectorum RCEF 264]|uniref:Uncharacterized protein n=1 Tax=Niveomyces insectorum RCEF 264 TaxID=1081102 RepID=A0A162JFP5_9HYPO|nr:hypothetical protein SPI_00437 [Niveomyces insectorum RCEF 264]